MADPLQIRASAVEYAFDIPTGRTERIDLPGTFVRVRSANRSFSLRLGNGAPFSLTPGSQYTCPAGAFFPNLTIVNQSADTLAIVLIIGQGDISADSTPQVERATQLVANAATSLAAADALPLTGVPTATLVQRRAVYVSNLDANLSLQIRDQAGNVGLTVFAETSVMLEVAGYLEVYNPNPGPIALSVSESWYINQ